MKRLIVTADDYGYTQSINEGIIRAATEGIVTDIAVMVLTDKEDLEHGLDLLKQHKLTEIGLHTSLFKWGKAERPQRSDFIQFFKNATDDEIAQKTMSEIETFEKLLGFKPKFISPQFNIHGNLRLLKIMANYVTKNNIPMRLPRAVLTHDEIEGKNYSAEVYLKRLKVKMPDHLFAHILGSYSPVITEAFINELVGVKDGESVEILLHPGYFDEAILDSSSLNYERARDVAISLDPNFKSKIASLGFTFSHMSLI